MVRRCAAKTVSGSPCSATPVRPSGYCYWHDPDLAAERDEARRRGGRARSNQARARKQLAGDDRLATGLELLGATPAGHEDAHDPHPEQRDH